MDAGTIDLCPSFCVHFELDTRGAGDGEYEGLSIIVSPPPPSSPPPPELPPEMTYYDDNDDLCGELGFWMGYGNSFGFGVQCESEWFTPGLYGEQKAYNVSFCLTASMETADGDSYSYAASITVDGDTSTND